ncbi:MAG: hypothetical protein KAH15_05175 [Candidatus Marinimicrobia bacterium]|nr:hypothetical protein [Candidatus Neomarinimicrobiota bacterium]
MAKTKKIIILLLIIFTSLSAEEVLSNAVYFKMENPYLLEISELLEKHDYILVRDSSTALYNGELFYYREDNDSIRCEIQLQKGREPFIILDSFMTEPEQAKNVRSSVYKFSIWMLILNAITAILFFVRSS